MKNKYYTPDIEEFHVGFEYEYYNGTCWLKCNYLTMYDQRSGTELNELDMSKERVKWLDQEDIESLGFESFPVGPSKIVFTKGNYALSINKYSILPLGKPCIIEKVDKERTPNIDKSFKRNIVFMGSIKNKSELKRLLKQLNIQ